MSLNAHAPQRIVQVKGLYIHLAQLARELWLLSLRAIFLPMQAAQKLKSAVKPKGKTQKAESLNDTAYNSFTGDLSSR